MSTPSHRRGLAFGLWAFAALAVGASTPLRGMPGVVADAPAKPRPLSSALQSLLREPGETRPVEGRLTGLGYVPFDAAGRGPASPSAEALEKRASIEIRLRSGAAAGDAEALHGLGLFRLLARRPTEAIGALVAAQDKQPRSAAIAADLAAAYLSRVGRDRHPVDAVLGLDAANRALEVDRSDPVAAFNRALALDRLHLAHLAGEAWSRYLELDRMSGWAAEARERLAEETRASELDEWRGSARAQVEEAALRGDRETLDGVVARFPRFVHRYATKDLLEAWAEAVREGDPKAARRALALALAVAEGLKRVAGEGVTLQAVDAIRSIGETEGESGDIRGVAEAVLDLRQGEEFVKGLDCQAAREPLLASASQLEASRNPLASWARLDLAICTCYSDNRKGKVGLARLQASVESQHSPFLRGRVLWMQGLAAGSLGEFGEAVRFYDEALGLYEELHEANGIASIQLLLAEAYDHLGDAATAWGFRVKALAGLEHLGDLRRRHVALSEAAEALVKAGLPAPALEFQKEQLANALVWDDEGALVSVHLFGARCRLAMGDEAGARKDLAQARETLEGLPEGAVRARLQAGIQLGSAELVARSSPKSAVQLYTAGLETLDRIGLTTEVPRWYRLRAEARRASGDLQGAEKDLRASIAEIARRRQEPGKERLRILFFDQAQATLDEMVRFQAVEMGNAARAFEYAERSKARGLLDRLAETEGTEEAGPAGAPPVPVVDVGEVQKRLPEDTALVAYQVTPDRLLIWTVRKDLFRMRVVGVSREELDREVSRFASLLEGHAPEAALEEASRGLWNRLLRPVRRDLAGARKLALVPDRSLYALPFPALLDPERHRYLLEDFASVVDPSVTVYLEALERSRTFRQDRRRTLLAVGNPAFDRGSFPELEDLPAAASEVREIGKLYPEAELLEGEAAQKGKVLEDMRRHRVVHFAAHTQVGPDDGRLSSLVLAGAGEGPGDGLLSGAEIEKRQFPATEVVVLSVCRSMSPFLTGREGVGGLARSFLAGGVPSVVASLWEVPDRATEKLLVAFHRGLAEEQEPSAALRAAQLERLQSSDSESTSALAWSAFEVFGGR